MERDELKVKKILFASYSLDVGGIETALITLLKKLSNKYNITLVLERKQGVFLNQLPKNINVITYEPCQIKNVLLRKMSNFFRQFKFKLKYKNKFDFSACFATYSFPSSFVARTASKNCALWVHNDYLNFYDNDIIQYRKFFKDIKIFDYKKIVFVSNMDKRVFIAQFPECSKKVVVCNNLIDDDKIIKKSEESVEFEKRDDIVTFINIGRHDEKQKRLSRIINATKKLNKEGYKFRVVFVGKGTSTKKYQEMSRNIKNIEFLGPKQNPYPYLKNSDALLMSSEFEGYPVVFVEAKVLNKPIITTDVSDSKLDIANKYGIVVEKSEKGVYEGMKQFLQNGFNAERFDVDEFNNQILEKLDKIISGS